MKQTMSCEQFGQSLDQYLDSELNPVQRAAFIEHARVCPGCGERLEFATRLMTMCAEMDEGVQMPLEGQTAWRRAIRGEAAARKKPARLPAFARGLSGLAAALLLLAGGTYAYQNRGPLSLGTINQDAPAAQTIQQKAAGNGTADGAIVPLTASGSGGMLLRSDEAGDLVFGMEPEADTADQGSMEGAASADDKSVYNGNMPSQGFDPSVDRADVKIVRYASRGIESTDFDSDLEVIRNLVEEYEGRFDDESIYGAPMEPGQTNGREAYLSARVPAGELDAFLTALDAVGTITAQGESRQEITKDYYDAQSRLNSLAQLHTELEAMIPQAQGVSELIEIKRELANVEAETEALSAQLSAWNAQVDYSTVSINMSEVADKKAVQPIDSTSLMDRIKVGFAESINMFSAFAQDMLVFCVMFWPWILLGLIVLIAVCASVRRRRRNRA